MDALWYTAPRTFDVRQVPIPEISEEEVLLKVAYCGVCGTDGHIHDGEFISKFPLIPGHEVVGTIVAVGNKVDGYSMGDRCVADNSSTCGACFYCRRGRDLLCENFRSKGVTENGGFAKFVAFHQSKLYKIQHLSDLEAMLVEPAACAVHGMDRLRPPVGAEVLLIGAGPTGLILSQLLKLNGAVRVVLAAHRGIKLDIAKQLNAADEYMGIDRQSPDQDWKTLKEDNARGFDIVIEATGSAKVANDAINLVRRGGTLLIYGVYDAAALVHWQPAKIFREEITIIGSFAQTSCFPRAVAYLDSGKIDVKGMVTDVFALNEYQQALDKMKSRDALKVVIRP